MCPCDPISLEIPDAPTIPPMPGFGVPFPLKTPNLNEAAEGFPEDLIEIFQNVQLIMPPGTLKPHPSYNYTKDLLDGVMSIMEKISPYLMLYKLILPLLNLVICIIEVLCAIPNPIKLVKALTKLFRDCIPQFLNLFPVLALILVLISLLGLLLSIIKYVKDQIKKLIKLLIKNFKMLGNAAAFGDEKATLAIIKKIGDTLCVFQNIFVIFSIFTAIFDIIKEMLSLAFALPPCDDGNDCCTPDVCPAIVKNPYTRNTGTFQYLNKVIETTNIGIKTLETVVRNESWQLYDSQQLIEQKFINIVDAFDVTLTEEMTKKPVFFPTDTVYSENTDPQQAAYTVNLRLFYNPNAWGRTGASRYIRIKDCIVLYPTRSYYKDYNNVLHFFTSGVLNLSGGTAYEDDGKTLIPDFKYGLNSFLHQQDHVSNNPVLAPTDGYLFENIEYTFKPNITALLNKNLITASCSPELSFAKTFVNNAFAADISLKLQIANSIPLPDTNGAADCLIASVDTLRNNISLDGLAEFASTSNLCLSKLENECVTALCELITVGFDPCKSSFTISPSVQFTTQLIKITVSIKDRNGANLTSGLSSDVADCLISKLKAHTTFGEVSKFTYDGVNAFNANITSSNPGKGTLMISFDNNIFCTNNIPADINIQPTRDLQEINYEFVYSPVVVPVAEVDTSDGVQPRRDYISDENKDGI